MKRAIMAAVLFSLSSATFADVGIGVSFQSDDGRVYVPIDLSESIRLEPSVRYYKSKLDNNYKYQNYELGIGLFRKNETLEHLNILIGARAGYIDYQQDIDGAVEENGDGYYFAPTLGIEYYFTDNFSIGGELSLRYERATIETMSPYSSNNESNDRTTTEVDTSLSARFYF